MDHTSTMTFDDMRYRGPIACVEYDEDDSIFVGHATSIPHIMGFQADALDRLETEFHISVDFHFECEARPGAR